MCFLSNVYCFYCCVYSRSHIFGCVIQILLPQIVICCYIQHLRFCFEVFFYKKSTFQVPVDGFKVSVACLVESLVTVTWLKNSRDQHHVSVLQKCPLIQFSCETAICIKHFEFWQIEIKAFDFFLFRSVGRGNYLFMSHMTTQNSTRLTSGKLLLTTTQSLKSSAAKEYWRVP